MTPDCTALELIATQADNNLSIAAIALLLIAAAIIFYYASSLSIPAAVPAEKENPNAITD